MIKKQILSVLILVILLLPTLTLADLNDCINNAGTSSILCNPLLRGTETDAGPGIILNYAVWFTGMVLVSFVIVYVVFSGFRMIVAQGNTETLEKAKSGLQWSLLGLVLILISYVIIVATQKFIGIKQDIPLNATLQNPLLSNTFAELISTMLKGLLTASGTLALLMIIISGFRYLTAGANEEQSEQAKTGLQWSVLGLIVILLAYVIVVAAAKLFTTVTQ